jgi:hypothetical protein
MHILAYLMLQSVLLSVKPKGSLHVLFQRVPFSVPTAFLLFSFFVLTLPIDVGAKFQ